MMKCPTVFCPASCFVQLSDRTAQTANNRNQLFACGGVRVVVCVWAPTQARGNLPAQVQSPITASLAQSHHLAEIYCTITHSVTVTVCKIKALRWTRRAVAEFYNQESFWKYRCTLGPPFFGCNFTSNLQHQSNHWPYSGFIVVVVCCCFKLIRFLFTPWQSLQNCVCSFLLWNNLQTKEVFYEGYVMAVTYKDMKHMGWFSNTVEVNGPLNFLLAELQWSLKTLKGNYESQIASSLFILKVIHIAYWSVHTSCMIPHGLTCLHCLAWNTPIKSHVSDSLIVPAGHLAPKFVI